MGNESEESAFENGALVPIESGHERSELIQKYAQEFGVNQESALEIFQWFEENWSPPVKTSGSQGGEHYRFLLFQICKELVLLPQNRDKLFFGIKRLIWRLDLPLGDELLNFETPADWARQEGISKEMSYRLANQIGERAGLPKRRDQRDEAACEKMSQSRIAGMASDKVPTIEGQE